MSETAMYVLMLLGPMLVWIYYNPAGGLMATGCLLVGFGLVVLGVSRGAIHEITAAILVVGGFALVAASSALRALEPVLFVARHFKARINDAGK